MHSGDFVAERWPELSGLPVLDHGELSTGTVVFRSFLVRDGSDYDVCGLGTDCTDCGPR